MKRYVLWALVASLPACTAGPGRSGHASIDSTATAALSEPLLVSVRSSTQPAIAQLPGGAGSIVHVREHSYENGLAQEIVLSGDGPHGENRIDIAVQSSSATARGASVPIGKPTEGGIKGEIAARLPDVEMRIVTRPMHNSYGPYGLAIGRHADGTRCVFAWQWIDSVRGLDHGEGGSGMRIRPIFGSSTPALVRIRLCRSNTSVDQLASYVDALEIGAPASLDRVWHPDRYGIAGTVDGGPLTAAVRDESLDSALGPRDRVQAHVAEAPIRRSPKRVVRRNTRTAVTRARQDNVLEMPRDSGVHYLAPPPGGEQAGGRSQSVPFGASPALDPSLPIQAYRGPAKVMPPGVGGQWRDNVVEAPSNAQDGKVPAPSQPAKSEPEKGQGASGAKGNAAVPPPP